VSATRVARHLLGGIALAAVLVPVAMAQGSGKVYYTDSNSGSNPTPFYEYDVATDTWTQKADIRSKNWTQLCADAQGEVYCLPDNGNIYHYDTSLDKWLFVQAGPSAAIGAGPIGMFETNQGEFYWAHDFTSTLYYTVGGAWTSISTPNTCACRAAVDRNTGYIYIGIAGDMGYFVFDPATGTFPISCVDGRSMFENARSGEFYNGEWITRNQTTNYIARDNGCNLRNLGGGPTSQHSSSALDSSLGLIYSNGWNDDYLFEVYDIAANTITALAPAPDIPGNAHSTLVYVEPGGASWKNYGNGFPGLIGIPGFKASNAPKIGQALTLTADNSNGGLRLGGFLVVGSQAIQVPGNWGGDLLASPDLMFQSVAIPVTGLVLSTTLPNDPNLVGVSIYLQVLEFDPGAAKGISNTPGLQLTFGQ